MAASTLDKRDWLSVAEVARQLDVSSETVKRWIRSGKQTHRGDRVVCIRLRALRMQNYRIRPADLEAFIEAICGGGEYTPPASAAQQRRRADEEAAEALARLNS